MRCQTVAECGRSPLGFIDQSAATGASSLVPGEGDCPALSSPRTTSDDHARASATHRG